MFAFLFVLHVSRQRCLFATAARDSANKAFGRREPAVDLAAGKASIENVNRCLGLIRKN
jgi:hypothetical protein